MTSDAITSGAGQNLPAGAPLPLSASQGSLPSAPAEGKEPAEQQVASDSHLKLAEELHQYVREYIRNADQKAAFFFAAVTAGLAYLVTHDVVGKWFKPVSAFAVVDVVAFVATVGLGFAAMLFLSVVFPRLKTSGPGLVFFNSIAEHSASTAYAQAVIRVPSSDLAETKLRHVYDLAVVCRKKYQVLRAGFWVGSVGAVAALVYLVICARDPALG